MVFYLPVVTPWWFENIIVHLIRTIAREHEVHVLIPPLWRGTGLSEAQIPFIKDLDQVFWHVLDGPDHPKLRSDASGEDDLIAFVHSISPDFVLCRSADIKTPARFPGIVRYIMEGAAPPLAIPTHWVVLADTVFDYGVIPELSANERAMLRLVADKLAGDLSAAKHGSRADWLNTQSISPKKRVIGLPLEYEHQENFFGQHHHYPNNAAMIEALCNGLPSEAVLAVTNHPLNDLYGDNRAIEKAISATGGKAIMLASGSSAGQATLELAQHCDGMIVGNSKSWALCAAFGAPLLRLSDFATGSWAHAYSSAEHFYEDIDRGTAKVPNMADAMLWFAFHLANEVFDPTDPSLSAHEILGRMSSAVDLNRLEAALNRDHALKLGQAA